MLLADLVPGKTRPQRAPQRAGGQKGPAFMSTGRARPSPPVGRETGVLLAQVTGNRVGAEGPRLPSNERQPAVTKRPHHLRTSLREALRADSRGSNRLARAF